VKFILALSRDVPYILMDEPFSGLDPMVKRTIAEKILRDIDLEKQTLIMSTHDILEVDTLLDLVVAIKGGNILAVQDVEELRTNRNMDITDWMLEIYA